MVLSPRKFSGPKDRLEPEAYALEQEQGKMALQRIRTEDEDDRQQVKLASRALVREKSDLQEREISLLEKASRILVAAKLKEGKPV